MLVVDGLQLALRDRYTIERELGRGGMATVYLATDIKVDRRVAIKVLIPELAAALGGERFHREIQIASHLTHPNILPVYDSGEADGTLYYVMPFVEGESLRDRLNRERQLSIDDAIRITCQVASALDHAHAAGIVHRDIKPENILLEAGQAVVADFGIARAITSAADVETLTRTGMSLGTPTYMSPEQVQGKALDSRSDIYSFGITCYHMFTGELPFHGETALAV
ncbi:MAG: serine/threonine-protein kinase, partial [Gemmatimonadaceae bacterium]